MGDFVHLHVHSEYSFLDGLNKIEPLVEKAKKLGMNSLALTDHGGMYGIYEFVKACEEAEVKPIVGAELYVARGSRQDKAGRTDQKSYHLTALAKNQEGYQNLIKLLSMAHIEGFYYRPRIDRELLENYHEGIVFLSGCLQGEIQRHIVNGKPEKAMDAARWHKELLGEDYYLEMTRFGYEGEAALEKEIRKISNELKIKRVATCDVHYMDQTQAKAQEVMWAISDGKRIDDPSRRKIESDQFYLKSPKEMYKLWQDDPKPVENTVEVADKCNVEVGFKGFVMPTIDIPKKYEKDYDSFLHDKALRGGEERLGRKLKEEEKERFEYELGIINEKKMSTYFLICADFANWMRENDIFVNTRGSAAGSLVAYFLGIVNANPLKFQLMFERFLNPERPKAPDVDFDIESGKREQVIQYALRKYGWNSVAHIITYDRMRTRAAIRDVGRVLGLPLEVVDKVAKLTPQSGQGTRKISLEEAVKQVSELKELIDSDPKLTELYEYASVLDGIARHRGIHACGVLITPGPIYDHVPVVVDNQTGRLVTQYDFRALEDLGLMKMDFLGVENLDVIKDAVRIIHENKGEDINIDEIIDNFSFDDEETYELINSLDTLGVFQLESDVMKRTLSIINPQNIFDIGASLALVRPGPNAYQEVYGKRRAGKERAHYLDKRMKDFLERSYGVLVYQEDLIRCVIELAGMSWGEADKFRKFTGKKIPDILLDQKDELIEKFVNHGMKEKIAKELFEMFIPFANYAFNEAHAAAYSIVTYLTAYLKANYLVEYMAALYKAHLGNQEKLGKISEECRRRGIEILPPDINRSYEEFVIEGDQGIRFGMAGIKGVGRKVISSIVKARGDKEFSSIDDLCARLDFSEVSKSALEALIKVGAMDDLGSRAALLEVLPVVVDKWQAAGRLKKAGQSGLFSAEVEEQTTAETILPDIEPIEEREKLTWEKELLGTYVSTHPAQKIYDILSQNGIMPIIQAANSKPGRRVKVVGLVDRLKQITTKNNKSMCFTTLQDHSSDIDVTVFPRLFEKAKDDIQEGAVLVVIGKIDNRGGNINLLADKIYLLSEDKLKEIENKAKKLKKQKKNAKKPPENPKNTQKKDEGSDLANKKGPKAPANNLGTKDKKVVIEVPKGTPKDKLKKLNELLANNQGGTKVVIILNTGKEARRIVLRNGVNWTQGLANQVNDLIL